jgi:hypothetical protein
MHVAEPSPETRRRWRSRRARLIGLVAVVFIGDLVRTAARGDWGTDGILWLVTVFVVAVGSVLFGPIGRRQDRHRASQRHALFYGFAQITAKPIEPPVPVSHALAGVRASAVFGRTAFDRDVFNGRLLVASRILSWEPGRIARDRGALPWQIPTDEVDTVEIGRSWNYSNVGLRFRSGGNIDLLVRDGQAVREALNRAKVPPHGSDQEEP